MSDLELYHYPGAGGGSVLALGWWDFWARRNLILMFLATEIMFQGWRSIWWRV